MSSKITDARIDELRRLTRLKEELQEKIQNEKDAMQAIRQAMVKDNTGELVSSSSRAAKENRNIQPSTLNHDDVLEAHGEAIERLEEQFAKVDKELRGLEELMKSEETS